MTLEEGGVEMRLVRRWDDSYPPAHLSYNDERRVRQIVQETLVQVADWLEAHDPPDVARAIREVRAHG
jgi:hypothetical protein